MGPLGWQEMMILFILALLLFGPKKLPELGKTIGKALTEFRRASNDLKSTWDTQMRELERETEEIKRETTVAARAVSEDTYSYDYDSSYGGSGYGDSYTETTEPSTPSASATQGAGASDVKPAGQNGTAAQNGTVAHSGMNAAGAAKPAEPKLAGPLPAGTPAEAPGTHA